MKLYIVWREEKFSPLTILGVAFSQKGVMDLVERDRFHLRLWMGSKTLVSKPEIMYISPAGMICWFFREFKLLW